MTLAATSTLALAKSSLRSMVAASAAFQAAVGAVDAAHALDKVYLSAAQAKDDREFASLRPFAVVGTHAEISFLADEGGTKNYLRPRGGILLYLTQNDLFADDAADSSVAFDNFAGGVIDDLQGLAGLDDNLAITELHLEDWYHSSMDRQKSQTPFWYAIVRVVWEN